MSWLILTCGMCGAGAPIEDYQEDVFGFQSCPNCQQRFKIVASSYVSEHGPVIYGKEIILADDKGRQRPYTHWDKKGEKVPEEYLEALVNS